MSRGRPAPGGRHVGRQLRALVGLWFPVLTSKEVSPIEEVRGAGSARIDLNLRPLIRNQADATATLEKSQGRTTSKMTGSAAIPRG